VHLARLRYAGGNTSYLEVLTTDSALLRFALGAGLISDVADRLGLPVVFRSESNFFSEFRQSQEVRRPEVSLCSPNSLKDKGNFIAEAPLLYLPVSDRYSQS
jgi:hypothetical protein